MRLSFVMLLRINRRKNKISPLVIVEIFLNKMTFIKKLFTEITVYTFKSNTVCKNIHITHTYNVYI